MTALKSPTKDAVVPPGVGKRVPRSQRLRTRGRVDRLLLLMLASVVAGFGLVACETTLPTTRVILPSNGTSLSGVTLLDADAADDTGVSRLEFDLTGGGYSDALIGVAAPSQYGWIYSWNTAGVPNGDYSLSSVAIDSSGNVGRSAPVSVTVTNALNVFVGYANNLEQLPVPPGAFPSPWEGSPNVVFVGCGCLYDAGAVRFDNTSDGPVTLSSVSVKIGTFKFAPWSTNLTVPAHQSLILTETQSPSNFDTSDTPVGNCQQTGAVPVVRVVIGGSTVRFHDVHQVLNTGGFDAKCTGNESRPWRAVID